MRSHEPSNFSFLLASAHPALPGHFPGHPIVPGVLLLDHVLTGVTTEMNRPVSVLQKVKFAAVLLPDETAMVACEAIGDRLRFSVQARRADIVVTLVTGSVHLAHQPVTLLTSTTPACRSSRGEAVDRQGRAWQRLAHSPDRMVGQGRGPPILSDLALPNRAVFRSYGSHGAACIARIPERCDRPPARWIEVFAHLYFFAATLLDRVYLAAGEFHRFHISVEGDALVRDALESGKGCLLLGSHLGSFDLMMLANKAFKGLPVNIMMHFDPRSRVRQIAGIDDSQSRIIPLGRPDSFLRAYELLERGEMVAALADRVDGSSASLDASFLGKPASFPLGPHVLAARAGVPVILFFGLYEGGADYRIEFAEFGPAAPADSRRAMLQSVVDRYAFLLEQVARRHPKNWFNFYPYWTKR